MGKKREVPFWLNLGLRLLFFPVLFLLPAGTWNWPEGWLLMLMYVTWVVLLTSWLKKHNPDLIKERSKVTFQKGHQCQE